MKTALFFLLTFSSFIGAALSAPPFTLSCENVSFIYIYEHEGKKYITISFTKDGAYSFGMYNYVHDGDFVKLSTNARLVSYFMAIDPYDEHLESIPKVSFEISPEDDGLQYGQWICPSKVINLGKVNDSPANGWATYDRISRCDNLYAFPLSCDNIEGMRILKSHGYMTVKPKKEVNIYFLYVLPSSNGIKLLENFINDMKNDHCSPGDKQYLKGYIQFERNGEKLKDDYPIPNGYFNDYAAVSIFKSLQKAQKAAEMLCPDKDPPKLITDEIYRYAYPRAFQGKD